MDTSLLVMDIDGVFVNDFKQSTGSEISIEEWLKARVNTKPLFEIPPGINWIALTARPSLYDSAMTQEWFETHFKNPPKTVIYCSEKAVLSEWQAGNEKANRLMDFLQHYEKIVMIESSEEQRGIITEVLTGHGYTGSFQIYTMQDLMGLMSVTLWKM